MLLLYWSLASIPPLSGWPDFPACWTKPCCRHIMMLKEPSAGSVWFTDMLNTIEGVKITPELIRATGRGKFPGVLDAEKARKKFESILVAPCGPNMRVVGLSQNPTLDVLLQLREFNYTFVTTLRQKNQYHCLDS